MTFLLIVFILGVSGIGYIAGYHTGREATRDHIVEIERAFQAQLIEARSNLTHAEVQAVLALKREVAACREIQP